ncbi:MAG: 50S ribosomal protein L35 [Bifidobacteriaceae bacterium]|jgi:large subunit ribosomal protein L35|nr:50S ribosomal protein L35 [Bifidobacteriaceae bacterium]
MPKNKTHSGSKKRFRVTGSGKLKMAGINMRHNLEHKSAKKKRALNRDSILAKGDSKREKKLLGI